MLHVRIPWDPLGASACYPVTLVCAPGSRPQNSLVQSSSLPPLLLLQPCDPEHLTTHQHHSTHCDGVIPAMPARATRLHGGASNACLQTRSRPGFFVYYWYHITVCSGSSKRGWTGVPCASGGRCCSRTLVVVQHHQVLSPVCDRNQGHGPSGNAGSGLDWPGRARTMSQPWCGALISRGQWERTPTQGRPRICAQCFIWSRRQGIAPYHPSARLRYRQAARAVTEDKNYKLHTIVVRNHPPPRPNNHVGWLLQATAPVSKAMAVLRR